MRLKSRTWFLVSLFLFAASFWMWRYAEQRAAQSRPKITAPARSSSKQAPPPTPGAKASNLVKNTNAPSATRPKSYRLSNTPDTIAQLARNDHAIILRNALIDTKRPIQLDIPGGLRAKGAPGAYIVQSDRPLDTQFRNEVERAGAAFVTYIPNNAALVQATPDQIKQISGDSRLQAILPWEPYYKLDSSLLPAAVDSSAISAAPPAASPLPSPSPLVASATTDTADNSTELRVTTYPGQRDSALAALQSLGANLVGEDSSPFGPTLIVKAPAEKLVAIAQSPLAQEIEPFVRRQVMNDLTRVQLGISADTVTSTNYLGLTGANIFVNVNDTGVEADLPDFLSGRVTGDPATPNAVIDLDGHGTHVGGIIAGNGMDSMMINITNPPPGSTMGANFRGKAPAASLYVQQIDLLTGPLISDQYLQSNASVNLRIDSTKSQSGITNGFISNNSWGYQDTFYDMQAASYDAAVRDAQPSTPGEQSMLFVFAAGNNGNGSGNGIDGQAGSITSPATAKNVITVGAIDSFRNITNEVNIPDDGLTNDPIWMSETDNSNLVANFSSCGPVGAGIEGNFGRFKPDVVAPGVFIVSDRAKAFVDPASQETLDYNNNPSQLVLGHHTNSAPIIIPGDAASLTIQIVPNASSPDPFPQLEILFGPSSPPTTLIGVTNMVQINNPGTGLFFIGVGNTGGQPVAYDLNTFVIETNALGDYYSVLSNLDSSLSPAYRFESGTSMSAPAVSGLLALMQEYLSTRMHVDPSPALLKALLINGSRSLGGLYDFDTQTSGANSQGWGLPNISNSIPMSLGSNNTSMVFYDQSPGNALSTGQTHTYVVNLPGGDLNATNLPLRVTLVWTDPPGDPAAGITLVNNLDLTVTDGTGSNIYVGNNFLSGDAFTEANNSTNLAASDVVNNVENVYIDTSIMPLSPPYTITVRGTRVNVNAVTTQTNDIKQDYALVISSDDTALQGPLTVSESAPPPAVSNLVTIVNSGVPLEHQRVGANEPNLYNYTLGATNGNSSQWHFFVFTNNQYSATNFASNVVFATFLPPNLSIPRATGADIDLYSSTDPLLLNLNPNAILNAQKSLNRGGNETIFYSNSLANTVYYIGVKSEDQQAADFTFFAVAQEQPFAQNVNGVIEATAVNLPVPIPDGSYDAPGTTNVLAFAPPTGGGTIARHVSVSLNVPHENPGDLVGVLTHPGTGTTGSVTLHSHTGTAPGIDTTYDDQPENPSIASSPSDGPGSLTSFIGQPFTGQWMLQETDNSLGQTGKVAGLTINIEPVPPDGANFTTTIPAGGWYFGFTNLPTDATNINIAVGFGSGGPVGIYITNSPNVNTGDYGTNNVRAPGGSLNYGLTNVPPLTGGYWYYGLFNPSASPITLNVVITVLESLTPNLTETLTNNTRIPLLTDAHTQSQICISNDESLISVNVGVRIDDTNDLDNLVLHLTSPQGTSILLFEDRGGTNAGGLGFGEQPSNYVYTVFTEDTNLSGNLIKFAPPQYAVSNYAAPVTNFLGGFESTNAGIYAAGQSNEGWYVLTNETQVISNIALAHSGSNLLALTSAQIVRTVPTLTGYTYELQFVSRGSGITDWWPGDGNTHDIIGTNNAQLTTNTSFATGEVGEAFNFTNATNGINVNTNAGNFGTNDFTIEFWVRLANVPPVGEPLISKRGPCANVLNFFDIRAHTNSLGLVGLNAQASSDGGVNNAGVTGTNDIADGRFHHVAVVRSPASLSIYIDGQFDSSAQTLPANLNSTNMLLFGSDSCVGTDGTTPFNGQLDEISFYNRALAQAEIYAIYHAGSVGKLTPVSVYPNARVYIGNGITNVFTNAGATVGTTNIYVGGTSTNTIVDNSYTWQTNAISFVASNNTTSIDIAGNPLGRLFDDFYLVQLAKTNYNNYYQPEESLSTLTGENPAGCWTLDVWDTRTDSSLSNNGVLLGWNMQMTFSSTNVYLIVLTNRVPYTTGVRSFDNGLVSNMIYFAFDVPPFAHDVTNLLISSPTPVSVFFNQTGLPTGNLPGDYTLISHATSGSYTLAANSPPPALVPGQRYFLGVQWTAAIPPIISIEVAADVTTNVGITVLSNATPVTTNIINTATPQYFSFNVPPNAIAASFEIVNPTNEMDMYARHAFPLPTPMSFDYETTYAGTNDETIIVATNSSPVPLTPGNWYLAVYNFNATNIVNYTVVATYVTNPFVVINLTNGLNPVATTPPAPPYSATPGPDVTTFYAYTIPTNATIVTNLQFSVTNATGNVDLLVQRDAFPTSQSYIAGSFNPGTSVQTVSLAPSASLPTLEGTWYLAVPNNQNANVTFNIFVGTNTAAANNVPLTASFSAANGMIELCWNGTPGQQYTLEYSSDLVNWIAIETVTMPASGQVCYSEPADQPARFYRVVSP